MFNQDRLHDLISAIQKSIRWCEVNEARYFAQELINMGVLNAVIGQLRIIAAEDIGLADPSMVGYMSECLDDIDGLIKQHGIGKKDIKSVPEVLQIVDFAVIAEAISYKSRLLPFATFSTLYDIYKNESFSKSLFQYLQLFVEALDNENEKNALYYAIIVDKIFGEKNRLMNVIKEQSSRRNTNLVLEWIDEYEKHDKILNLAGSVVMMCRELNFIHGEYREKIDRHLSIPIKTSAIPDRAYDQHTRAGKKKGRGLQHFFEVSGTVKNKRFNNDWRKIDINSYLSADREGLADDAKIIKAIKNKLQKTAELLTV